MGDNEILLDQVQPIIFRYDLPFGQYKCHYLAWQNYVDLLLGVMNVEAARASDTSTRLYSTTRWHNVQECLRQS
jgi:hypothetical protein